jgi:hypothetical protein
VRLSRYGLAGKVPRIVSVSSEGNNLMSEYRRLQAHEFQPTIDWRALFVLSTLVSGAKFCAAVVMMHF